jgi:hypothetical protein
MVGGIEMNTKIITLVSRWNDQRLNLRVSEKSYVKLRTAENPMEMVVDDIDRVICNAEPRYISSYQAKKVHRFFGKYNINYFNRIEF